MSQQDPRVTEMKEMLSDMSGYITKRREALRAGQPEPDAEPVRPQLRLVVSNPSPVKRGRRRDATPRPSAFEQYEADGQRGHQNPIVRALAMSMSVQDCRRSGHDEEVGEVAFDAYLDRAYAELKMRADTALVDAAEELERSQRKSFDRLVALTNAERAKSGRPPLSL
jgi:hypothetical protein